MMRVRFRRAFSELFPQDRLRFTILIGLYALAKLDVAKSAVSNPHANVSGAGGSGVG